MIFAIGLAIIGFLLIYFEFFVPGGILGVLGGVMILAGLVLAIWEQMHLYWIFLYVFGVVLFLVLTIKFALWKLKQKPSMYASADQEGYLASDFDKALLGMEGKALTDLKPSGHIEVEGRKYQAVSESAYVKKGETIKIVGGEGARYKVRKSHG